MRARLAECVVSIAALSAGAWGQSPGQTAASKSRIDTIWAYATNQMLVQQDAWFDDGDFPACISLLGLEAEKWHKDYDIWTNLGWMEENVQDWGAAVNTYTQYRNLNPAEPDRSLPLGQYYFMKKDYARIPDILEPIIRHKCHPNNYRILAWSYEKMHRYSEAVRVWKSFLAVDANDAAAKRNLAKDEKHLADGASK